MLPELVRGDVRLSDADRERALQALHRHYADGCLDQQELERRADSVARARYRAELRPLFADLPRDYRRRAAGAVTRVDRAMLRAHAGAFATTNGALVGVWALAGAGDFWPAWVLLPWGALLAGHAWSSRSLRRWLGMAPRRRRLAP